MTAAGALAPKVWVRTWPSVCEINYIPDRFAPKEGCDCLRPQNCGSCNDQYQANWVDAGSTFTGYHKRTKTGAVQL